MRKRNEIPKKAPQRLYFGGGDGGGREKGLYKVGQRRKAKLLDKKKGKAKKAQDFNRSTDSLEHLEEKKFRQNQIRGSLQRRIKVFLLASKVEFLPSPTQRRIGRVRSQLLYFILRPRANALWINRPVRHPNVLASRDTAAYNNSFIMKKRLRVGIKMPVPSFLNPPPPLLFRKKKKILKPKFGT